MKKYTTKYICMAALLAITGCSKEYYDINKNPNLPTGNTITPELILPSALHNAAIQTSVNYGWLNNWMGYWSVSASFSPNIEERTYNITGNFGERNWDGLYNTLFDLYNIENKAGADDQYYRAIALVIKAHLFQNLVDIFGNVPYSQAFQSTKYPTPVYDKAEDIYANLKDGLDTAINIFEHTDISTKQEEVDIVYGGDALLWVKMANTIKLRMLLRLSKVNTNPTSDLTVIQDHYGILESDESAEENPGYAAVEDKQNPYFNSYGELANGNEANNYYRANNHLLSILRGANDPRLAYIYKAARSPIGALTYNGTTYGAAPVPNTTGDNFSNIGEGLAKAADHGQWLVTSVESLFLKAEAIARGWLPGNEQEAYEEAVTESFKWLGVEDAEDAAADYFKQPIADWSKAGSSIESKVSFILFQKYIAMAGLNPLEAWADYRRTGIPANPGISVDPARISNTLPARLLYPTTEYAVNPNNVRAQGAINQFTSKLFWHK